MTFLFRLNPSHPFCARFFSPWIFLFFIQPFATLPSAAEHLIRALPAGSTARFECASDRPAIWIKNDGNQLLSFGGRPFDTSIDPGKFNFTQHDHAYVMTIKGVTPADAGGYKCANVVNVTLLVAGPARCAPPDVRRLAESAVHEVRCEVAVGGRPRPKIFWSLGRDQYQGRESWEGNKLVSTFELTPSLEEHGKSLYCNVNYGFYWNSSEKQPSCGWPRINVHFGPKLHCPASHAVYMDRPYVDLECKALSNPPLDESNVSWSFSGVDLPEDERKRRLTLVKIPHGFRVIIRLDTRLFALNRASRRVTVTARGRSHSVMKIVTLRKAFGPLVSCPESVLIRSRKSAVSCDVLAYPLPAARDLEWNFIADRPLPRDAASRSHNYTFIQDIEPIDGGARVTLRLNASQKASASSSSFLRGWNPNLSVLRLRVGGVARNISLVHVNPERVAEKQPLIRTATFVTLAVICSVFVGITFLVMLLMCLRAKFQAMRRRRALEINGKRDNMWHLTMKKSPLNMIYS